MAKGTGLYDILSGLSEGIKGFAQNRFNLQAYRAQQQQQTRAEALQQQQLKQQEELTNARIQADKENELARMLAENQRMDITKQHWADVLKQQGEVLKANVQGRKDTLAMQRESRAATNELGYARLAASTAAKNPRAQEDKFARDGVLRIYLNASRPNSLTGKFPTSKEIMNQVKVGVDMMKNMGTISKDVDISRYNDATLQAMADLGTYDNPQLLLEHFFTPGVINKLKAKGVHIPSYFEAMEDKFPGIKDVIATEIDRRGMLQSAPEYQSEFETQQSLEE